MCVSTKRESAEAVELDAVLSKFPVCGRYHLRVLALLFLTSITNAMYSSNFIFGMEEVSYRCKDESIGHNYTCGANGAVGADGGEAACTEWVYDDPNSFVAEFQLACQEWKRTMVGTAHSLGNMAGLLLVGPMSDRIGRKLTVVMTGVAGAVIGVIRTFVTSYWLYVTLEALEGAIGDISSPAFMLTIEMISTEMRVPFTLVVSIGYPVGDVIMCYVAWLCPYWRTYLRVIYSPAILFILYFWLLDESPRWLLSKGKREKAGDIIKKAARINKMKIDESVLENLTYKEEKSLKFFDLFKSTFRSKALVHRFLICVVWWVTSTFVSYGMMINSVSLQGDKYLNFGIICSLDIPGFIILIFALRYCDRRSALRITFLAGGLLCLIQPFVPTDLLWLSTSLYMIGKLMSTFFFDITYIFTSELFPTYTRNSMHALCSAIGRTGSILAPQTPLLTSYWIGLPALLFGGMALTAGLLTLLVPETAHDALPDNVQQAEALGMGSASRHEDPSAPSASSRQAALDTDQTFSVL